MSKMGKVITNKYLEGLIDEPPKFHRWDKYIPIFPIESYRVPAE